MNPSDIPPPFPNRPAMVPPPRQGMGAGKIILIVLGVAALGVVALGVLIGTNFERIQKAARKMASQQQPSLKPPAPLTAEQEKGLAQFGQELAEALTNKDSAAVKAMQDNDALATRVFEKLTGIPQAANVRAGFMKGVASRDGGWMWSLMEGDVVFLRTRERHGFPAVLLRMKSEAGAVNYVEVMVRLEGAGFKAVDMFNYVFATTTSEEARNVMAVMTAKSGAGGLAAMLGIPHMKMDEDVASRLEAITKAKQKGDVKEVLRICDSLPAELKTQRSFFIIRLQALMELSSTGSAEIDNEYKEALRAAHDILGKDSTTDLLMVDLLFLENDLQGADDSLKKVEAVIGGDPYLKFLRGNARLQMKDYAGALALAAEVQKEDPKMADVVDLRLAVHLARKDHKAVLDELRAFKKNFGVTLDRAALAEEETYKDFIASPEFATWEREIAAP